MKNELHTLLSWHKDLGIDEVLHTTPQNRFDKIEDTLLLNTISSIDTPPAPPSVNTTSLSFPLHSPNHTNQQALELANQAQNLDELRACLASFEGCALKHTATNLVFGDGNPNSKIMLVGEAPGADEDRLGLPFVGLSGQLLDKMFRCIGLDRTQLYVSNIISWRPPGNRPPTTSETAACLPFIQRHIEIVNPEYLIMVGGTSVKTLMDTKEGIMKLRGKWIDYTSSGLKKPIKAMAIFHPAYLLRSPAQKREAWKDLIHIKNTLLKNGFEVNSL